MSFVCSDWPDLIAMIRQITQYLFLEPFKSNIDQRLLDGLPTEYRRFYTQCFYIERLLLLKKLDLPNMTNLKYYN